MEILLYAPEYRPNLSNMIRSAEFFGFKRIYIYDQNGLLDPPTNRVSRSDMNHLARVWTAGAIEFIDVDKIEDAASFLNNYDGRTIATVVDPKAKHLQEFTFQQDDLLIMGPEKEGLPVEVVQECTEGVYLPHIGQTDCLNVSVSLGIFLYQAQLNLRF